jgi:hypothetical protein
LAEKKPTKTMRKTGVGKEVDEKKSTERLRGGKRNTEILFK